MGIVLGLMGLIMMATGGWGLPAGLLLIVAGAYFGLKSHGIDVNLDEKAVREYVNFGMLKTGQWREYPTYPNICIIRREKSKKVHFADEVDDEDDVSPYQFEIHLVSRSHRGKVLLDICPSRASAERKARDYAAGMGIEVAEYNPPGKIKSHRRSSHRQED
jgi:hypothetical protein